MNKHFADLGTRVAFTVCTNSHLGQAKTMADSLVAHNLNYQVCIGLVDKLTPEIDQSFFEPHLLIEIEEIRIDGFADLLSQYNLLEMSCLAKPYFAAYLFDTYAAIQKLLYFDTDMLLFGDLARVESLLETHNVIITPHMTAPLPDDDKTPALRTFLNSGIYNAGFFAIKRSAETFRFLGWWQAYLRRSGYVNFCEGMFVDQLPLNLMPLFFEGVLPQTDPGYNVAYWNLHERMVSKRDGELWVNDQAPLLFFHFSGYHPTWPNRLSLHQNRHQWADRPDVWPLFEQYRSGLVANKHDFYIKQPNAYYQKPWHDKIGWLRGWIIVICRKILKILNA